MKKLLLLSVFSLSLIFAQRRQVYMIGPMVHFNIGEGKVRTSWGLEMSYWNYEGFPYSVDFGLEFEKRKFRFYSEAQTGIGLMGVAIGPVAEVNYDEKSFKVGLQTSLWMNYFLGLNLRYRRVGKQNYFAPGTYFKIPFGYDRDENNNSNSSGGKSEILDAIF